MYKETGTISSMHNHPQPDFQEASEWTQFWESVGLLKGLTTLEVIVTEAPAFWIYGLGRKRQSERIGGTSTLLNEDFGLLDPLRALRQLDRFEVTLPQRCQVPPRENEPFQLTYKEDGTW